MKLNLGDHRTYNLIVSSMNDLYNAALALKETGELSRNKLKELDGYFRAHLAFAEGALPCKLYEKLTYEECVSKIFEMVLV